MATVTKAVNAHTGLIGSWTNPSNAFATTGDDTYATAAPPKNGSIVGTFNFPDFTTSDIPDGSTINSVTTTVEWGMTASVTGGQLEVDNFIGVTGVGTLIKTTTTEAQQTNAWTTLPTLAQLRSASTSISVDIGCSKGSTNTAMTGNLDFASITVDFTAPTMGRMSQEPVEVVMAPTSGLARVSQEPVEVVMAPTSGKARVSHLVVEAVLSPNAPPAGPEVPVILLGGL